MPSQSLFPFPATFPVDDKEMKRTPLRVVATLINCPHSKWRDERKKKNKALEVEVEA